MLSMSSTGRGMVTQMFGMLFYSTVLFYVIVNFQVTEST